MELHPLCTYFPRLAGAEFTALCDDIAAHGLQNPIITLDGMILDGGNRFRACEAMQVKPRFTKFTGDNAALFVLSQNLHRRHLTPGQRAAIVASTMSWEAAQRKGRPTKGVQKNTFSQADTTEARARAADVSTMTQRRADAVQKKSPALAKKVARGEVKLGDAVRKAAPHLAPVKAEPPPPAKAAPKKRETFAEPKSGAPEIAKLNARIKSLEAQLEESRSTASDLADSLESYATLEKGEHAAERELTKLKGQLRTAESQRNIQMQKANDLAALVKTRDRTIASLEAKIRAMEKANA